MTSRKEQDARELAFDHGFRRAWVMVLGQALHELGYSDPSTRRLETLVKQIEEARLALREVCAAYGDNDWDDKLRLADVIEKHLGRHLDDKLGGR